LPPDSAVFSFETKNVVGCLDNLHQAVLSKLYSIKQQKSNIFSKDFAKSVDKGCFLFETMFESEQLFEQLASNKSFKQTNSRKCRF